MPQPLPTLCAATLTVVCAPDSSVIRDGLALHTMRGTAGIVVVVAGGVVGRGVVGVTLVGVVVDGAVVDDPVGLTTVDVVAPVPGVVEPDVVVSPGTVLTVTNVVELCASSVVSTGTLVSTMPFTCTLGGRVFSIRNAASAPSTATDDIAASAVRNTLRRC